MPVPSPILASLSPALRRLEAAAACAPELTPEQEAVLSTLVAETVEKLDEIAARLERARTPRDAWPARASRVGPWAQSARRGRVAMSELTTAEARYYERLLDDD